MSNPSDQSQFWLAGMDTIGVLTRRHFARPDDIKSTYRAQDPASRYSEVSDVLYADRLGGLILQPDWTLHANNSANLLLLSGGDYTRDCTPPALGVATPMYYYAGPNPDPNVYTWHIQGGLLPAGPSIIFHLVRTPAPPVGQTAQSQRWQLTFGGLVLTWGRFSDPVLTTAAGVEISRYTITERDREKFATDTLQRWEIASLGGELYISCSGFSDDWTVVYPTLPAAPWGVLANGGKCAANVTALTFASSGYLITPWINEGVAYPDADLIATTWPTNGTPTSAAVTVEAVDGTRKKYRLTLTSSNPYATPIVRAFQTGYNPTFAALSTTKTEITDYFVKGRESLTEDWSARTTNLQFRETAEFVGLVGRLSGHRIVSYATGYDAGDGVPVRQLRMTGIMRAVERTGHDATLTIYDLWTMLNDVKLFNAPNIWGLVRGQAISTIAQCAGIHPDLISIAADVTGNIGDPSKPFGEDGPRWQIEDGTSAADVIRKIASTYGLTVYFNGAGVLTVQRYLSTAIANTYSAAEGTSDIYGLGTDIFEGVTFESDLTGARNHLVVIGQDRNGQPIAAPRYDRTSVTDDTSERYMGYWATEVVKNPDLATLPEVVEATAVQLEQLDYGLPKVALSGNRALALCHQLPKEFILVTDSDVAMTARTCKIKQMDVEIDELDIPVTSMTLVVYPAA